ncbi:hypothetical protein TNIN_338411 [Trichonephila inaurata madagascariensis]|uniref:Uncharacterized protein n=1 Tax=Trichonephila inaurata madagascariensis TaxID=2747483 RepID=A0A8X7BTF4_9ARAC|nr:hypothetical protein TNIN_338411 [Trichonephila inaurata madagascariensis]
MAQFQSPLCGSIPGVICILVPSIGKKSVISVDRLKPAFMEIDDLVPAQVKPVQLQPGLVQCRPRLHYPVYQTCEISTSHLIEATFLNGFRGGVMGQPCGCKSL